MGVSYDFVNFILFKKNNLKIILAFYLFFENTHFKYEKNNIEKLHGLKSSPV